MRTSISGCLHLHTGLFGVIVSTQAFPHKQHFVFMWHPRLLQEINLECDKKLGLSNRKVLIMVEASSLAEFFLHRNVTYKLLKQNCKTNLCGNACATGNIALNCFCQNLFDWLQTFVWIQGKVSLLLVEGKRLSHLSDLFKLLKVQDNKITLSFKCLIVIIYSAYQTYVAMSAILRILL